MIVWWILSISYHPLVLPYIFPFEIEDFWETESSSATLLHALWNCYHTPSTVMIHYQIQYETFIRPRNIKVSRAHSLECKRDQHKVPSCVSFVRNKTFYILKISYILGVSTGWKGGKKDKGRWFFSFYL